jgi:hypothetical protein
MWWWAAAWASDPALVVLGTDPVAHVDAAHVVAVVGRPVDANDPVVVLATRRARGGWSAFDVAVGDHTLRVLALVPPAALRRPDRLDQRWWVPVALRGGYDDVVVVLPADPTPGSDAAALLADAVAAAPDGAVRLIVTDVRGALSLPGGPWGVATIAASNAPTDGWLLQVTAEGLSVAPLTGGPGLTAAGDGPWTPSP